MIREASACNFYKFPLIPRKYAFFVSLSSYLFQIYFAPTRRTPSAPLSPVHYPNVEGIIYRPVRLLLQSAIV